MPFIGVESGSNEPVPGGDDQIGLLNPRCDLLAIEFTELENEMFSDRRPVQRATIEIHRRIRAVRALAED